MEDRQVILQSLDPYINNLWVAPATAFELGAYWLGRSLGTIPASTPPPGAHLVQITQLEYSASAWAVSPTDIPLPITFFANGRKGILLSDALAGAFVGLTDAEQLVGPLSNSDKVTYRIQPQKYPPFRKSSPSRRATILRECLARSTVALHVANAVFMCIQRDGGSWDDDSAGTITFDELFLLELRRVSRGSWQPVLAVYRA
ncbi:hypothetical protein EIP86_001735 [Pleurotus ostreatoroseus]|nr:hypothetical protein EIP86_001735 [Pleurotus ostreatoroseus]